MRRCEYPLKVGGERVWRSYPGGRELDRLHGAANPVDANFPEEWMLSVTRAVNQDREHLEEGICYLDGIQERISLKQLIEQHPVEMLGAAHADEYGAALGVLVKLLDSLDRLVIQVHPDQATARRLFNSRFGKTECWHIMELRRDGREPCIYLGFRPGISPAAWKGAFHRQDTGAMLGMMNRILPRPGETYIVPGGEPHAIGPGCFIIEIQEPTDLTIRLERIAPGGIRLNDAAMHQGLGFDRMFECFHYTGKSAEEAAAAWRLPMRVVDETPSCRTETLVGYADTPCFRMDRLSVTGPTLVAKQDVFSGLYVKNGSGWIECGGETLPLARNDQVFLPAACKEFIINSGGEAGLEILRLYGPLC
ncbi:MAG: class I mannose-6-phosphate isomerase [Planctomycetes bacterium]|nr:class I mannose-6-phosphate isomerase [Planctomycetota bacterium]